MKKLVAVPYYLWLAFFISMFLLFLIFLWSIFGTIPMTITGKGIVISKTGLTNIQARVSGTVTQVRIRPNSMVKKGEILMKIYDPELELKFEDTKSKVAVLKEQIAHLQKEITQEATAEKEAIATKMDAVKFTILQIEDDIEFQTKDLKKSKQLLDEGLISLNTYQTLEYGLMQRKIDLEEKIGDLAVLNSEYSKEYRPEELKNKEQDLLNEIEQFNLLKEMINQRIVYSQKDGKVIEVLVSDGDFVPQGTTLVWMENQLEKEKSYLIYAYFPVNMGKRIHLGTPTKMSIEAINPNEYGSIKGKVVELSSFAVSKENIFTMIHNRALIDYLVGKQTAVIQAIIEPEYDHNQIQWTSGKNPPLPISTGMVGQIEATVEKIRPIYYLVPFPGIKTPNERNNTKETRDPQSLSLNKPSPL